jgi:hypothetical protein
VKTLLLSAHVADDEVLIALAASFPLVSLTSLTLGKFVDKFDMVEEVVPCWRVTNEGIKAISCLTTLTSLELNHCEGVWGNTGVGLLAALPALTRLSLAGFCTDIPEIVKVMRLLAPLTVLSSLSVQCCYDAVADEEVSALLGLHTSSHTIRGCIFTVDSRNCRSHCTGFANCAQKPQLVAVLQRIL